MGKQFDMVRIGLLLYGYKPFKSNKLKLSPVMKVSAPILKQRTLKAGENALYGQFSVAEQKRAQIVRLGYADGLERKVTTGQINNRCMDVTMIERTKAKRAVTVMDNAQKLADKYKTIPYEILVKASIRAEKKYIR